MRWRAKGECGSWNVTWMQYLRAARRQYSLRHPYAPVFSYDTFLFFLIFIILFYFISSTFSVVFLFIFFRFSIGRDISSFVFKAKLKCRDRKKIRRKWKKKKKNEKNFFFFRLKSTLTLTRNLRHPLEHDTPFGFSSLPFECTCMYVYGNILYKREVVASYLLEYLRYQTTVWYIEFVTIRLSVSGFRL